MISGGAVKGSTDWLDPEEPRCWYCQCFSSDGFRGLEDLEASLVALRPDLGELLGFVKDLREKGPGASPGIRNGIRVVRDGSNGAVIPGPGREGGIGRKPAAVSGLRRVSLDSDTIVLSWEFVR